jgi:allophanate hydrolase subunit 2
MRVRAVGDRALLLDDHRTRGGYPVLGVVVPEDLAVCAQLRPGDEITLRVV